MKRVSRSVKQEIAAVCSEKFPSVFKKSAECFEVDTVITEVHSRAPSLSPGRSDLINFALDL